MFQSLDKKRIELTVKAIEGYVMCSCLRQDYCS